jgi:hypothetical protein
LKSSAYLTDAIHAGRVPGDGELVHGFLGVGAGRFVVLPCCLDGGEIAEDHRALLAFERLEHGVQGFVRLR